MELERLYKHPVMAVQLVQTLGRWKLKNGKSHKEMEPGLSSVELKKG